MNRGFTNAIWMTAGIFASIQTMAADRCKSWSWETGSRVSAQFALASEICLNAIRPQSEVLSEVAANAEARGHLFSIAVPVLRADATARTANNSKIDLNAGIYVVGQKIWNHSMQAQTPSFERSYSVPAIDISIPYGINLGPVSVELEAGVRGSAAAHIKANAGVTELAASLTPDLDTSGYASAYADAMVASAGAEGSLLFARGSGAIQGKTQLAFNQDKSVVLKGDVKGSYDMQTLDGAVKIYADGFWASADSHEWEYTLFEFPGYSLNGTLFEASIPSLVVLR